MYKPFIVAGTLALGLAACSQEKKTETTVATEAPASPAAPAPAAEPAAGVVRNEPAAAPAAEPALATQPGPKGTQVALTKARVVGDILNIELHYSQPPTAEHTEWAYAEVNQINYIDDATSRKYDVLKDQSGNYMAMPMSNGGKRLEVRVDKGGMSVVSLKFPAPPASSPTVSLSIPEVGTFDAITVQR